MDWLSNIKSFIDVIDHQSFTKAAEKRYASPAAISRRISWLEDRLGVKLIERTTRTLQLTEEGKYFYEKGKQLIANLNDITTQLQTQKQIVKGPLKITMPYSFSESKLVKTIISEFIATHTQVDLILDLSNKLTDLINEEIDIAFRASPDTTTGYTSEKISLLNLGIYASPEYLEKHGIPKKISELSNHNCLLHYHMGFIEWEFKNHQKQIVNGNIKSNATKVLIEYAKNGLGIVRTLDNYVNDEIKNKILIPILQNFWPEPLPLYLIYRTQPTTPLRVKAFVEYIQRCKNEFF